MKNIKLDKTGTKAMRERMAKVQKVKITINIDLDTLSELKNLAGKSGASYQKLLNQILKEGLANSSQTEARLEKLEKEVDKLRKRAS